MHTDFGGLYFDAGLIGPNGRLSRLHKGASKPPPPPPVPAPVRVEADPGGEAMRGASRRDGLAKTILADTFSSPTLGKKARLGASGGAISAYGGEV